MLFNHIHGAENFDPSDDALDLLFGRKPIEEAITEQIANSSSGEVTVYSTAEVGKRKSGKNTAIRRQWGYKPADPLSDDQLARIERENKDNQLVLSLLANIRHARGCLFVVACDHEDK